MISVVCIYNNQEILDNCLIKSLKKQNYHYELIPVDNTQNKFKSAAKALNYGGNQARGEYIMFIHQDMELNSPTWLSDVEEMLRSLEDVGVIGVAGRKGRTPRSNMKQGTPPQICWNISPRRSHWCSNCGWMFGHSSPLHLSRKQFWWRNLQRLAFISGWLLFEH